MMITSLGCFPLVNLNSAERSSSEDHEDSDDDESDDDDDSDSAVPFKGRFKSGPVL